MDNKTEAISKMDPDVVEFYKSLQANDKIPKIENEKNFIMKIDSIKDEFKVPFVATYALLNNAYKMEVSSKRAKLMKQNIQLMKETNKVKTRSDVSLKLNKFDFIPNHFNDCSSLPIKIAVALFLKPSCTESLKRDFVFSLLNDTEVIKDVNDVIALCFIPTIGGIREYIKKVNNVSSTEKQRKNIICGLIESAEILKDRSSAKLAICISQNGYITLLTSYLEIGKLKSIIPFEPLINLYIKESIAKYTQEEERLKLYNQFKIDPEATIKDVINGLPPPPPNKVSNSSTKSMVFKNDQMYEYYKGVPNYTRDIITTYHSEGGRRYRIQTYNDCLYDVIGYTSENVYSNDQTITTSNNPNNGTTKNINGNVNNNGTHQYNYPDHELYDRLSWSDRLNMVHFRTKIRIQQADSKELNEYCGNPTDITISWFDENGTCCSKTVALKKSDAKNMSI
ncbi:GrBNV gp83-like protein-like protein [Mauternbach virus]|uniref:GrBNV gp83-like protein-like protein n=1 Tax=Mauternbach virus TaxID=2486603 RepID=A0A3G3E640_9VIRU|nr:GrBNV gp83-like protein-like protein [Mauternbach virus]AYP97917.1 GrBNV gp83-like protein-like protein [Mauternbach virus]